MKIIMISIVVVIIPENARNKAEAQLKLGHDLKHRCSEGCPYFQLIQFTF